MSQIPNWNMSGVIPPIRPGVAGSHPDRSPYQVSLYDFFDRFAITVDRISILEGLLRYRADWRAAGVTRGFQWLDGSFSENVEDLEERSPNDIDVVTFFYLPEGHDQESFFPLILHLIDTDSCKGRYSVDGYPSQLGGVLDEASVTSTAYWYSMWSHRRTGLWKGFVQVDIDDFVDERCADLLAQRRVALAAANLVDNVA